MDGAEPDLTAERAPHATEVQARRARVFGSARVVDGHTLIAEHPKIADQRFEASAIPGRADHRIGTQTSAIDEHDISFVTVAIPCSSCFG